mgnify:CR=1 FL=1
MSVADGEKRERERIAEECSSRVFVFVLGGKARDGTEYSFLKVTLSKMPEARKDDQEMRKVKLWDQLSRSLDSSEHRVQ